MKGSGLDRNFLLIILQSIMRILAPACHSPYLGENTMKARWKKKKKKELAGVVIYFVGKGTRIMDFLYLYTGEREASSLSGK